MPEVLFPTRIDQWTWSVASKLRELIIWSENTNFVFNSFSRSPSSDEDRLLALEFWSRPNIRCLKPIEILSRRFDIVHHAVPTPQSTLAALLVRARSAGKTRHIYTASVEPHPADMHFQQMGLAVRLAHLVSANSKAVADGILFYFGRHVEAIIPNGVDTAFFSPTAADTETLKYYGISRPYVLFSGVMALHKRPDLFIELARQLPEISFVMIGRQTEVGTAMLAEAPRNVQYLGLLPKRQVRDLLAFAEVLVFPSEREGLPNAVLEAIAMGIPVLAQPKSSLPDLVVDDKTGWLLSDENLGAWVEHVSTLVNWPETKRREFQRQSRAIALNKYSWREYSRQHLELYTWLLNR